jgi:hypothetical protein
MIFRINDARASATKRSFDRQPMPTGDINPHLVLLIGSHRFCQNAVNNLNLFNCCLVIRRWTVRSVISGWISKTRWPSQEASKFE